MHHLSQPGLFGLKLPALRITRSAASTAEPLANQLIRSTLELTEIVRDFASSESKIAALIPMALNERPNVRIKSAFILGFAQSRREQAVGALLEIIKKPLEPKKEQPEPKIYTLKKLFSRSEWVPNESDIKFVALQSIRNLFTLPERSKAELSNSDAKLFADSPLKKEVVLALTRLLGCDQFGHSFQWELRRTLAEIAISETGSYVQAITECMLQSSPFLKMRAAAAEVLQEIMVAYQDFAAQSTGEKLKQLESAYPIVIFALRDYSQDVRVAALYALGAAGAKGECFEHSVRACLDNDGSEKVRIVAIRTLGRLQAISTPTFERLRHLATHGITSNIRHEAQEALEAVKRARRQPDSGR